MVVLTVGPVDGQSPAPPVRLVSSLLRASGFEHGFFTRRGGVSEGAYASLNVAASNGDSPENVSKNLARAERALGVEPGRLYFLSQVHGVRAERLDGSESFGEVVRREGDVTVSSATGVACGVRSADCGTVLVADRASGVVAAIHAGWRGTVAGVVGAGVAALRQAVGSAANLDLVAAVGPHIQRCCFEVGLDVAAELAGCSTLGEVAVDRSRDRPHVDLRAILVAQLVAAGVSPSSIDPLPGCTVCDVASFFSFRRDGKESGRLLSAIVAR